MDQKIVIGYWGLFLSWLAIRVMSWVQINHAHTTPLSRPSDFLLSFEYENADWRLRLALVSALKKISLRNMDPRHTASTSSNKVSLKCLLYYMGFSVSGIVMPTAVERPEFVYWQEQEKFGSWEGWNLTYFKWWGKHECRNDSWTSCATLEPKSF